MEVSSGVLAVENEPGVTVESNQIFYTCQTSLDLVCYYIEDVSSILELCGQQSWRQG